MSCQALMPRDVDSLELDQMGQSMLCLSQKLKSSAHLAMNSSALGGAWPTPGRLMPAATLPGALLKAMEVE
jgi:hypothetical protein